MGSANKTKVLDLPQWLGNEYFERLDMNEAFSSIEEAVVSFDFLCDRYGYSFTKTSNDNSTVFDFKITGNCPYAATKKVTKSIVDGVKQFRTEINIDGTITIFVDKKTANGWDGSVE